MSENRKNQANNNKSKGKSINNGELRHSYSTPIVAQLSRQKSKIFIMN